VRGETHVALWDGDAVRSLTLTPRSFGLDDVDPAGLAGGDAGHNARAVADVLAGRALGPGERLEAAVHAAGMTAALGLELLEPAFDRARLGRQYARTLEAIATGAAERVLAAWREASRA